MSKVHLGTGTLEEIGGEGINEEALACFAKQLVEQKEAPAKTKNIN